MPGPTARAVRLVGGPAAVALVLLAGCSAGTPARPEAPAPTAPAAPAQASPTATVAGVEAPAPGPADATPVASAAAGRASVLLRLDLVSAPGAAEVVVTATASGAAPRLVLADGSRTSGAGVRDVVVDYGDGAQDRTPPAAGSCRRKAPLGALALTDRFRHTYARPGRYVLTWSVTTCAPRSTAARTTSEDLAVEVRAAAPGAPGVRLAVRRTSPDGDRQVALAVTASGSAPRAVRTSTGTLSKAGKIVGVAVDFGDGTTDDSGPAQFRCAPDSPDGRVSFTDARRHTYAEAGTYTVTYAVFTCAPGAALTVPTTRAVQVTVR